MTKDFNRTDFDYFIDKKFMLYGSSDIFIATKLFRTDDFYICNLNNGSLYSLESVANGEYDFDFFRDEEDDDYLGVEII